MLALACWSLPQDRGAVGGISPKRSAALWRLLELCRLTEVLRGSGIVSTIGEGLVDSIEGIPGVRAEGSAVVCRTAVLVDLGLTTEVADRGPALRGATVREGDAFDLEGLKIEPARNVVRVARGFRRASGHAILTRRRGVIAGVTDLPNQSIGRIVNEPPSQGVPELLDRIGWHQRTVDLATENDGP